MSSSKILAFEWSKETELAVLGAILKDPADAWPNIETLTPDEFYATSHRLIFERCCELEASGKPIDAVSAYEGLKGKSEADSLDISYLVNSMEYAPISQDLKHHAQELKRLRMRRDRMRIGGVLMRNTSPEEGARAVEELQRLNDEFNALGKPLRDELAGKSGLLHESIERTSEAMEAQANGGLYLKTGIADWDKAASGFYMSDLIVFAARPGAGKTAISVQILCNALKAGKNVLFVSLEMERIQLIQRMISGICSTKVEAMRSGDLSEADLDRIIAASRAITEFKGELAIPDRTRDLPSIRRLAQNFVRKYDRLDLIVVDYLQLLDTGRSEHSREREVAIASIALKSLAKEMNVPVLALAQLNRDIEKRTDSTPRLSDLRESGSIEQDADQIYFLSREKDTPTRADLFLAKNRHGANNINIPLAFNGVIFR